MPPPPYQVLVSLSWCPAASTRVSAVVTPSTAVSVIRLEPVVEGRDVLVFSSADCLPGASRTKALPVTLQFVRDGVVTGDTLASIGVLKQGGSSPRQLLLRELGLGRGGAL